MSALFPDLVGPETAEPVLAPAPAAAYRVLARKYRPRNFTELIGQDVVVRTLTNAIRTNRLAQAWMLTGVRGVGKTTTARIIARALNCTGTDGQSGPTPEPCDQCANCLAIAADRHVDVLEMDAASRTGVDDIREIIDGVRYNPVNARYKIYIIDEVHMLSKNAFNALLKTLEEPPPHVKFIFATTEIRKVPVTVLSRCQRFDLRRVDAAVLARHFAQVAEREGVTVAPEALQLIARAADGSVRDGLSLLDQAIARAEGAVDVAVVQDMLGLADRSRLLELAHDVLSGEMRAGLLAYGAMLQSGADPLVLLQDIAEQVHSLTRSKLVPDLRQGETLPQMEKDFLSGLATLEIPALTRAWQILLKGIDETQRADNPAVAAEMVLIRLAYAAALPPPGDLIKQLQQEVATAAPPSLGGGGNGGTVARGNLALAVENAVAPLPAPAPAVQPSLSPQPQDFAALVALFAQHKEVQLYAELYNYAQPVRFEAGRLEIALAPQASPDLASKTAQRLTTWTGTRWMVTVARAAPGGMTLAQQADALAAARREAVLQHPLVQQALALFPAAKLANIRLPAVQQPAEDAEQASAPPDAALEPREEQDE